MDFLKHNLKPEEHPAQAGQDKGLFDKLGDPLQSQTQPAPAPQPAAPKQLG